MPRNVARICIRALALMHLILLSFDLYDHKSNDSYYQYHEDQGSVKACAEDVSDKFATGHCEQHYNNAEECYIFHVYVFKSRHRDSGLQYPFRRGALTSAHVSNQSPFEEAASRASLFSCRRK